MKVSYIEVAGFRSFGAEPQRLEFSSPLAVIHADNSQGKTSLAEAFEFLLTGTTSRRQLGGGSPQEYSHALRNVHLPDEADVYVEAGIQSGDAILVLRRVLTKDYDGASDCLSVVTVDGKETTDPLDVGIRLAEPPIAAPVLLEHALRYAVSAKPAERSIFFRAIIEAADLDEIRRAIDTTLSERTALGLPAVVAKVESLAARPQFSSVLKRGIMKTPEGTTSALQAAMRSVVPRAEGAAGADSLESALRDMTAEMGNRQQAIIPLDKLAVTASAAPSSPRQYLFAELDKYAAAVRSLDGFTAALIPIFEIVLQSGLIPHDDHGEPTDCPVCNTPRALSPQRIAAMRAELGKRNGLTTAQHDAIEALEEAVRSARATSAWAKATTPAAAGWTQDQVDLAQTSVSALGGNTDDLAETMTAIRGLSSSANTVIQAAEKVSTVFGNARTLISAGKALGETSDAQQAIAELNATTQAHAEATQGAEVICTPFITAMRPLVARESSTDGWQDLIDLSGRVDEIAGAIAQTERESAAMKRLKSAQNAIVAATRQVLDSRLNVMADEIRRWWSMMRPDELTTFGDLTRRSGGNKMLDLTAALIPEPDEDAQVRNALAVLSNSQMNALGLATFLARCQLLKTEVVFLDDPVPGSDPEHRTGFSDGVVGALIKAGTQVIVATHDPALARDIETLNAIHQPDEFSIAIVAPSVGSVFDQRGDDFEHLMLEASSQMHSPLETNRRAAGNSLRVAAERLAKHVIVAGRQTEGDMSASPDDYTGKNLSFLGPAAVKYAAVDNEPGYWTQLARILNAADHDAPPPLPADLKRCWDWLRDIKKKHKISTRSSGAPQVSADDNSVSYSIRADSADLTYTTKARPETTT